MSDPLQGYALGLVGYPLTYSLSPRMHAAALRAMGLAGEYRLYPVPPGAGQDDALAALFVRMRRGEIQGLNVTIPHKTAVLPFVDELSPRARSIGAANTMRMKGNVLIAENTDAPGFLLDLRRQFPALRLEPAATGDAAAPTALVIGGGGAARAVVYALANLGLHVAVATRREEQAQALTSALQAGNRAFRLEAFGLDAAAIAGLAPGLDLIVNASSAGMVPDVEATPWPAALPLPSSACIYDLVYKPRETALLRMARDQGAPAANGLGMLVEQAAIALEIWTGRSVPREPMERALQESK